MLGVGVFFYVLLDGFDLGVGILYGFAPDRNSRNLVMNSIAPIWDGNETWLVLGGLALMAAFPLAFAIIMPAVYFPIAIMLLALIFRGVAFEFRYRDAEHRTFWDHAFNYGSIVGAFAQGIVLGAFIQGFQTEGRHFSGGSFDCFTPFSLLTGVALVFGYGLLGAGWLILKTEGALQDWARALGRRALIGVLIAIALVSLWTPLAKPEIAERWFSWPNIVILAPVPDHHRADRLLGVAVAQQPLGSRAVHRRDPVVRDVLPRPRDQPLPADRALQIHPLGRGVLAIDAGLFACGNGVPAAGHPHVHRLVLLGVSRQSSRRRGLSLGRGLRRPRAAASALAKDDSKVVRGHVMGLFQLETHGAREMDNIFQVADAPFRIPSLEPRVEGLVAG